MKRITLTICAAATLFLFSCNDDSKTEKTTGSDSTGKMSSDTSAKTNDQANMPPMDSAAMMKAWMDYMTPGSVHTMLAKSNGTWDADITMWDMDPAKPPTKTMGTTVNSMILGGRYQQSINKGNMMGMPFEGRGTLGYDNAKKMLVSSWIDNMGTGIGYMEGTWDSTSHSANLKGKMVDPMTGKDLDCRETFSIVDDNNQKMEMFCTRGGKEMKMMEIAFKRK